MPHIAAKPLTIFDLNCHRGTQSATMADSADKHNLVLLKLLSGSTTKPQSATSKFIANVLRSHLHACR